MRSRCSSWCRPAPSPGRSSDSPSWIDNDGGVVDKAYLECADGEIVRPSPPSGASRSTCSSSGSCSDPAAGAAHARSPRSSPRSRAGSQWAAGIFGLVVLQVLVLPILSREVGSGFGALHGVNALLILMGLAAMAARRVDTTSRRRPRRASGARVDAWRPGGRRRLWLAGAATAAFVLPLGWFWYDSLLPDTYDLASMGYPDWGGGPQSEHGHHDGTPVAELTADPDRPADVSETLTVRHRRRPLHRQRHHPGPGAARHRGRPGRGDPGQRRRRRRRHAALARRGRPQRRRRRGRRDPGRRHAGRGVRLPLRRRPGRHVLVPLPPGLPRAGAARPARRAGDRASGSGADRSRRGRDAAPLRTSGPTLNGARRTRHDPRRRARRQVRIRVVNTDNGLATRLGHRRPLPGVGGRRDRRQRAGRVDRRAPSRSRPAAGSTSASRSRTSRGRAWTSAGGTATRGRGPIRPPVHGAAAGRRRSTC